ncbi:hypothetical protein L3V83_02465 [Thiotrichales bacterium 19X7-9]|nr:hypothetical protein [Thiotrichales bacterium 19X7-9]
MNFKRFIAISVLTIPLSIIPLSSYAKADYTLYVRNTLSVPVTVSGMSKQCIKRADGPKVIPAKPRNAEYGEATYTFTDDNAGLFSCLNKQKKITFKIDPHLGDAKVEGKTYDFYVRWRHENQLPWATKMYEIDHKDTTMLSLTEALCKGKDCLNKWRDSEGNMDLVIRIESAPGAEYSIELQSLQLGDVVVSDGFGKPVYSDPLSNRVDLKYDEKYIIRFTKSQAKCTALKGMFHCPSSVDFTYQGGTAVFTCTQLESGDPNCPWIMSSANSGTNGNQGFVATGYH